MAKQVACYRKRRRIVDETTRVVHKVSKQNVEYKSESSQSRVFVVLVAFNKRFLTTLLSATHHRFSMPDSTAFVHTYLMVFLFQSSSFAHSFTLSPGHCGIIVIFRCCCHLAKGSKIKENGKSGIGTFEIGESS